MVNEVRKRKGNRVRAFKRNAIESEHAEKLASSSTVALQFLVSLWVNWYKMEQNV